MYNLWNFDPWHSDFTSWRAAARLPLQGADMIKPRIVIRVETWRDENLAHEEDIFVLQRAPDPADVAPLMHEQRKGYGLVAYRIDPQDYARVESLRARIIASRKTSRGLRGKFTVNAAACGKHELVPDGKFLVSTYLLVDRRDGYNPLLTDFDLSEALRLPETRKEMAASCAIRQALTQPAQEH